MILYHLGSSLCPSKVPSPGQCLQGLSAKLLIILSAETHPQTKYTGLLGDKYQESLWSHLVQSPAFVANHYPGIRWTCCLLSFQSKGLCHHVHNLLSVTLLRNLAGPFASKIQMEASKLVLPAHCSWINPSPKDIERTPCPKWAHFSYFSTDR